MKENESHQPESYLLEIFDIAKYAVSIEDMKTFRKSSDMLNKIMQDYVGRELEKKETNKRGLRFSEIYIELMSQIRSMVCKQEDNFFAHDSWLISVWYDPRHFVPLSEDTLLFIWRFVLNVIDADKEDWFMSYWTYADQYYSFQIVGNRECRYNPVVQNQLVLMKQMHLGIGAYLLYKKKYSLLMKILNFTQTIPPSYYLLDNTFSQIIADMSEIYKLLETPLILTQKYKMSGLTDDVNSDSYVAGKFNDYFALLMVRLSGLDFNVSYCEPLQQPSINQDSDISMLQSHIKYVDVLLRLLNKEDFGEVLEEVGYSREQTILVKNKLASYREVLTASINDKFRHPATDSRKIEYIKNNLIHEINSQKLYLPVKKDSELSGDITKDTYYSGYAWQLSKEDVAKYMDRLSANLEEALIAYMLMQECNFYNRFFLLNKPVGAYTIRFRDLIQAWGKLGIDDKYMILSMGVYLGTYTDLYGEDKLFAFKNGEASYNGAKIMSLQSSMCCFVIISKDSLPYIEHSEIDGENAKDLKCIDQASALYSNVDDIDAEKNKVLVVRRKVNIVHKTDFTRYVMLKIVYRNDSSSFDLEKIENLTKFIVTEK